MNLVTRVLCAGFVGTVLVGVFHAPSLPHRPVDSLTNWGQGHSPLNGCPSGTLRVETDEGFFLECFSLSHYFRGTP